MTFFQLLLILGVLSIAILAMAFVKGERSLAMKRLFALIVAVLAIVAIIFPNALTQVAHILGIGRGADLLLYVFVIVSMLFAVSTMRAKARSDARVTELARAVALMEARLIADDNCAEHGEH